MRHSAVLVFANKQDLVRCWTSMTLHLQKFPATSAIDSLSCKNPSAADITIEHQIDASCRLSTNYVLHLEISIQIIAARGFRICSMNCPVCCKAFRGGALTCVPWNRLLSDSTWPALPVLASVIVSRKPQDVEQTAASLLANSGFAFVASPGFTSEA